MKITAKFAGRCGKCGQGFAAGTEIGWVRGGASSHVSCPAKASSAPVAASAPPKAPPVPSDLSGAPYEVWGRIDACKRPAMEAWVRGMIGETLTYERHLPRTRVGASAPVAEAGVYVVVGAGAWRYQSTEDNEDMGDMTGANWSGPLYLRRATPEEEAVEVAKADRVKVGEAIGTAFASLLKLAERAAHAAQDALEEEPGNARASVGIIVLSDEEKAERAATQRTLWSGAGTDAGASRTTPSSRWTTPAR